MDRPYTAGRHILNLPGLISRIRHKWAGSVVQAVQMDGLTLQQQMGLFQNTSVLIWTHGAAMADLLFLPQVGAFLLINQDKHVCQPGLGACVASLSLQGTLFPLCCTLLFMHPPHEPAHRPGHTLSSVLKVTLPLSNMHSGRHAHVLALVSRPPLHARVHSGYVLHMTLPSMPRCGL